MSSHVISGTPAARFAGPPADRMAGRQQARAARAARAQGGNFTPKQKPSGPSDDQVLDQAIHQGVINAGMRGHYQTLLQSDPAGTRAFLAKLGLSDIGASYQQAAAASNDEEYLPGALTKAEQDRVTAAREGRTSVFVNGGL
jgi:hypothetical protein